MENTLENKATFFAQHWGQWVLSDNENACIGIAESTFYKFKESDWHLILKPLSSITDEDAVEVAKMLSYYANEIEIERRESEVWLVCDGDIKVAIGTVIFGLIGRQFEKHRMDNIITTEQIMYDGSEILNAIDFLRSKGYALPFMGLSVEQLVEYGWLRLTD